MADGPQGTIDQLKAMWGRLTRPQRISLVGFAGGVLAGLVWLVLFMGGQEDFQTLYSSLSTEDANAVVTKLKERKVPYQLSDNGSTIKVPGERVPETRLMMAGEGLPQSAGVVGNEVFDKQSFGQTEADKEIQKRRALEGELARTIRGLEQVARVRVHLTMPKESLFTASAEPAKASVVIHLKPGRDLSPPQVNGLRHLVASTVPTMRPEHVSVLDAHGKVLSGPPGTDDPSALLTSAQLRIQREAERDMAQRMVSLLEAVVGVGKARADVSLHMDFSRSEVTEDLVTPNNNAVLSQQKSEERLIPGANAAGGIPGTRSNQPGGPAAAATAAAAAQPPVPDVRLKQNEVVNNEPSRTHRNTIIPQGSLKRLSVAVVVDDKLVARKEDEAAKGKGAKDKGKGADAKDKGPAALQALARTPEEMANLRLLVEGAVGFNKERGDDVRVVNISFDTGPPEPEAPTSMLARYPEYTRLAIKYGAIILVVLIVYFIVLRPVMKQVLAPLRSPAPQVTEAPLLPEGATARPGEAAAALAAASHGITISPNQGARGADWLTGIPAHEASAPLDALDADIAAEFGSGPDAETLRMAAMKKRLIELVMKEPHTAASLLRTWLEEK